MDQKMMKFNLQLAQWMKDNEFRLSRVQGFHYGDDLVVRDLWNRDEQEIWREPFNEENAEIMMTYIKGYQLALAMEALDV